MRRRDADRLVVHQVGSGLHAGTDRQSVAESVDFVLGHQHVAGEVDVRDGLDADVPAMDRVAANHDPIGQSAVETSPNAGAGARELIAADDGPAPPSTWMPTFGDCVTVLPLIKASVPAT